MTYKDQGRGRHRRKRGKLREFSAKKPERDEASREATRRCEARAGAGLAKDGRRSGRKPKAKTRA